MKTIIRILLLLVFLSSLSFVCSKPVLAATNSGTIQQLVKQIFLGILGKSERKDLKKPFLEKKDFRLNEEVAMSLGDYQPKDVQIEVWQAGEVLRSLKTKVEDGKLKVIPSANLKPGKYTIKIISNDTKYLVVEQDFTWGVLAINTNKSVYLSAEARAKVGLSNEKAYLQMASLDENGHTLCNASLKLEIRIPKESREAGNPKSEIRNISTDEGTIQKSGECGADNVTDKPDYFAYYEVDDIGKYELKLTNLDNNFKIEDSFEVKENIAFDIERVSATRINPFKANYTMTMKVKANQDFEGEVVETVPDSFKITNNQNPSTSLGASNSTIQQFNNETMIIIWQVDWKKDGSYELSYEYNAPDISPQFYMIGPLTMKQLNNETIFSEQRQWQIASDAANDVILLWDTANNPIPTGWGCISCASTDPMYGVFPMASNTYSGTTAGTDSHNNHAFDPTNQTDAANGTAKGETGGAKTTINTHAHTWTSPTIGGGSLLPPYKHLEFIFKNNPTTIPANVIGMFDSTSVAVGWTNYSAMTGKYLRGFNNNVNGGTEAHTHTITVTSSSYTKNLTDTGKDGTGANTHTHPLSGTTDSTSNQPPFINVYFAYNTVADSTLPSNLIAFFNAAVPSGWTDISTSGSYTNRFLMGASTGIGDTGGSSANHTHNSGTIIVTSDPEGADVTGQGNTGTYTAAIANHTHNVTYTVGTAASLPAYRTIFLGKKDPYVITVGGNIYTNETGTAYNCTGPNNKTVAVRVNGLGSYTAECTTADGAYSVPGITVDVDDVITVFLDGETEKATTVTKAADIYSNISGLPLYQNRVFITHQSTSAVSNTNLSQCASACDDDIQFTTVGTGLTVNSGNKIVIASGKTYTPGGNIQAPSIGIGGTFSPEGNIINLNAGGTGPTCTAAAGTVMPLCINSGTFNSSTSIVNFVASTETNLAPTTYYNVGVGTSLDTAAGATFTLGGNVGVGGTFTVGNASSNNTDSLNGSSYTLTLSGGGAPLNFTSKGDFTAGTSTVTFTGGSGQAINSAASSLTFNNIINQKTAGQTLSTSGSITTLNVANFTNTSGNFTAPATMNISGTLTLTAGTYTAGANTNMTGGDWTNNGGTFTANSGTVTFNNASADQNINGTNPTQGFYNLIVDKSGYSQIIGVGATNLNVTNALTINAGTFDPGASVVLNSGGAAGTISGSGTIKVTRIAATADYVNQYKFSTNTLSSMTVDYAGAGSQTVNSTVGNYGGLKISGNGTKTMAGNINIVGDLNISAATLDLSSYTANRTTSGGTMTLATGTNLKIGGTGTIPANYSTHSVNAASTIEYNGSTQTVGGLNSSQNYGNLTVSAAGIKTLGAPITVATNLTVSAGTLSDNGHQLTGNATGAFSLSSGAALNLGIAGTATIFPTSFTGANCSFNAASTVTYASGQTQTVSGVPAYGNLTIDGGSIKSLGAGTTADGTLTITAGDTLDTTGNNYPLNPALVNIASTGTLNIQASTLTITGTSGTLFTNAGTFTAGTNSTTKFTGATTPTALLSGTFTGAGSFYNLEMSPTIGVGVSYAMGTAFNANNNFTINPTSGGVNTLTVTLGGNSTVTGTTQITGTTSGKSALDTKSGSNYTFSTATLDIGTAGTLNANNSNAITINGGSGTIFSQTGAFNAGGSTVVISGSGAISLTATTFNNLTVTGVPTTSSSFTVNGALIVSGSGNLSPSTGIITMATNNWTIANSATLVFSGLTISETPTSQSNTSYNVAGALTVNLGKTLAPTGGIITMNTGSSIVNNGGATTNLVFKGLTIDSGATVASSSDFSVAGTLINSSTATFHPSGGTITMTGTAWGITNSGTLLNFAGLTTAGTASTQPTSSFSIDGSLTVNNGVTLAPTAGTITMTGGSIVNNGGAAANLVFKNLTFSGATSSASSFNVIGDWTNNGTFSQSAGIVTFNGSGAQQLTGANNSFFGLSITAASNRTVTITPGSTLTIINNGSLNFQGTDVSNQLTLQSGGADWYLHLSTTGTSQAVSFVKVSRSNAADYQEINASNGTNTNLGYNPNWNFGGAEPPANSTQLDIDGDFNFEGINFN